MNATSITVGACLVIGAAGLAYGAFGPAIRGKSDAPALVVHGRVLDDGRRTASIDAELFIEAGMPAPLISEADPVTVDHILGTYQAWRDDPVAAHVVDLGLIYVAMEEHNAALEAFAAARAMEPSNGRAAYLLGITAQRLGRTEEALGWLGEARRLGFENPSLDARLATLFLAEGDLDTAEASFRAAQKTMGGDARPLIGLGRVALARGRLKAAETYFRDAVNENPSDFMAHRMFGQTLAQLGRADEARPAMEQAARLPKYSGWLSVDPELQTAHARGETQRHLENEITRLQASGPPDELLAAIERLLERRPNHAKLHALAAQAHLALKDQKNAWAAIDRAIELAPQSAEFWLVRGQIALTSGDVDAAMAAAENAVERDPESAVAHDLMGRALYLSKEYEEAYQSLERAIELSPGAVETRFALAMMLANQGKLGRSHRAVTALLQIAPEHGRARQLFTQLEAARQKTRANP